jgi:hypothetical protein
MFAKSKFAKTIIFLVSVFVCNAKYDVNDVYVNGDSTLMEMKIESSYFGDNAFLIETTGARFEFIKDNIKIYQGFNPNNRRLLSEIKFENEINFIRVESTNDHILFWSDNLNIGIYGDSSLIVSPKKRQLLSCRGAFKPDFQGRYKGELLLIDEEGGLEVYPQRYETGYEIKKIELNSQDWVAIYQLNAGERVMIAAFPGKSFDWEKSFNSHIVTTYGSMGLGTGNVYGQMPPASVIESWSRYFNIISFSYEGLYKRFNSLNKPYPGGPYIIENEAELDRLVATAHQNNMKVIVYVSLYYHNQINKDVELFYQQIKTMSNKFGIDGVYIGGLLIDVEGNNFEDKISNWKIIRRLRELFGTDGVIVCHGTSQGSPVATVPNIDSYCNATLNGEGVSFGSLDDPYIKYQVRKYGISNTIGLWKKGKHPDSIRDTEIIDAEIMMNCRRMWGGYVPVNEPPKDNKYRWNTSLDHTGWGYYLKKLQVIPKPSGVR